MKKNMKKMMEIVRGKENHYFPFKWVWNITSLIVYLQCALFRKKYVHSFDNK